MRTLYENNITIGGGRNSGGSYPDYYNMWLQIREDDSDSNYNIVNNKNTIYVKATFRNNKSWTAWTGYTTARCPKFTLYLYDNKTGVSREYTNTSITSLTAYQEVTLFDFSIELEHFDNGTLDISASLSVNRQYQAAYFPYDSSMSTGNLSLHTIPRATPAVGFNSYIEDYINIPLNPYVSSFTHSVKINFGSISKFINASGNLQTSEYKFSNSTIPFTIPKDFYNQFTGKYGTGTIEIRTYNGNTQIGSTQSTNITANCKEERCRPNVSGIVKDINQITKALTGDENKIIKYFSNITINLTISASSTTGDNSTITSRVVEGTTITGTTITLNKVTKKDFNVIVTNSRGFSTPVVVSATGELVEYFTPIVNSVFERLNQTSDNVKLKYSANIFKNSFGVTSNSAIVKWYYRLEENALWQLGGTLNENITDDIEETIVNLDGEFSYLQNYRFKLEVTDKLGTGLDSNPVTAGIPSLSIGKTWAQFHVDLYRKDGTKI